MSFYTNNKPRLIETYSKTIINSYNPPNPNRPYKL